MKYKEIVRQKTVSTLQDSIEVVANMSRPPPETVWQSIRKGHVQLRVGDWVEVQYAYMPGVCSDGGVGVITKVHPSLDPDDGDPLIEDAQKVDVVLAQ